MARFQIETSREHKELYEILQKKFPKLHKVRVKFLVLFLIALLKVQTVCLTKLASGFSGSASKKSRVRRIQRFLAKFALDLDQVAQLLWSFLALEGKVVLILDRTNWKFGQKNLNILMLSVAYQGVSIPLLWTLLDKRGSSSESERIALLGRFVRLFGAQCIAYLLADREFIGKDWLSYLQKEQIAFIIRIRENALVDGKKGGKVKKLFTHLKVLQGYYYTKARKIYGVQVYLSARRSPKGLLIVMSSTFTGTAIQQYARRWEIETMFKAFKTQGFQLENSHITHLERFEKLLALIAIAFYWAYRTGIVKDKEILAIQVSKSTLKKEYSFFNYGLEALREALLLADYHLIIKFTRLLS